jgi:hypothetical protein
VYRPLIIGFVTLLSARIQRDSPCNHGVIRRRNLLVDFQSGGKRNLTYTTTVYITLVCALCMQIRLRKLFVADAFIFRNDLCTQQ